MLDKKGRPVTDLTRNDFIVLDKGKPQEIAKFSVEKSERQTLVPLAANHYGITER